MRHLRLLTIRLCVIVGLLCFAICGCHSEGQQVWLPSHPNYVPFSVRGIVVSDDNRFVGLTVDTRSDASSVVTAGELSIILVDLKIGVHKLIGSGDSFFRPIRSRQFLYYRSETSPVLLLDGLETVRSFTIGERRQGWWNAANQRVIFETAWSKDREGFNRIGLLNITTGETDSVDLKDTTELLTICAKTGRFYTESYESNEERRDEYDSNGLFISRSVSPLAVYSANCRYVLPFAALPPHGPGDWAVFDAATGSKLMDFLWSDTDPDSHWFIAWNPQYDNLLLARSGNGWDVVHVGQRRNIRHFPGSDEPVAWSGDGRATVTVRDRHIVFEALPGNVLEN